MEYRRTAHVPYYESFCSPCRIYRVDRRARCGGAREKSRHWNWHSRLSYPIPSCSDRTRLGHLGRSLAWRTAARAFLLAPPPWNSQVDCATCCLYAPLCSVLQQSNAILTDVPFTLSPGHSSRALFNDRNDRSTNDLDALRYSGLLARSVSRPLGRPPPRRTRMIISGP